MKGEVSDQLLQEHKYDISTQSYLLVTSDPDELFGGYFIEGGARAWTDYKNPKFNELFAQQSAEPDFGKRKAIVQQMAKMLMDDSAMIFALERGHEYAWRSYFKGFNPPQATRDQNYRRDNIWDGRKVK
ncbi:MAG: hypothetical protein Q8P22_03405 [Chloroflexota bacterium]|nr:hypothetical protein [Chloroflexota bacterium]